MFRKEKEQKILQARQLLTLTLSLFMCAAVFLAGCSESAGYKLPDGEEAQSFSLEEVPAFEDSPFVVINENQPEFTEEQKITDSFERYDALDSLGRCGQAFANVGCDIMPTEKRGSIGMVKPSGWHLKKYDIVSGKYLYNRCHLVGYQLTAENANRKNLITGTRYLNVEGMLPFENMVADYVKETGNHVLYRVTPIYEGNELVARGVQMEGWSVEDEGEGICFNVYCYNNQPGIEINYATGESRLSDKESIGAEKGNQTDEDCEKGEIRGNRRSKIYHCPGQNAYADMEDSKNLIIFESEEEAMDAGYRKAKR